MGGSTPLLTKSKEKIAQCCENKQNGALKIEKYSKRHFTLGPSKLAISLILPKFLQIMSAYTPNLPENEIWRQKKISYNFDDVIKIWNLAFYKNSNTQKMYTSILIKKF